MNSVYFPGQKLRFKINDPSKKLFLEKDGFFGIVSKRKGDEPVTGSEISPEHHTVGVVVKIIDQQQVMSNLVQNHVEFSVEAVKRFKITKVIMSQDDQIVKICEVKIKDDSINALPASKIRDELIIEIKDKALKLIELFTSLSRN